MERLTTYHCGVAVIKDKELLKEAMARLASYEDTGLTPAEIMDGKLLTGWIPVGERLPKNEERVLTTTKHQDRQVSFRSGGKWYLDLTGNVFRCDPFAWMPLPESYKPSN